LAAPALVADIDEGTLIQRTRLRSFQSVVPLSTPQSTPVAFSQTRWLVLPSQTDPF
jgi:hypothetical protein